MLNWLSPCQFSVNPRFGEVLPCSRCGERQDSCSLPCSWFEVELLPEKAISTWAFEVMQQNTDDEERKKCKVMWVSFKSFKWAFWQE